MNKRQWYFLKYWLPGVAETLSQEEVEADLRDVGIDPRILPAKWLETLERARAAGAVIPDEYLEKARQKAMAGGCAVPSDLG